MFLRRTPGRESGRVIALGTGLIAIGLAALACDAKGPGATAPGPSIWWS
jgi:hypothetical protein